MIRIGTAKTPMIEANTHAAKFGFGSKYSTGSFPVRISQATLPAATVSRSRNVVFIETENATPKTKPTANNLPGVVLPPIKIARLTSHNAAQNRSGLYSPSLVYRSGNDAARSAPQNPARTENNRAPIQ